MLIILPITGECPQCKTKMLSIVAKANRPPQPQDAGLCNACGIILKFTSPTTLAGADADDLHRFRNDPQLWGQLLAAQDAIRKRSAARYN